MWKLIVAFVIVWKYVVPYMFFRFYFKSIVYRALVLYHRNVISQATINKATQFYKNHKWLKLRAPVETEDNAPNSKTYKLGRATMVFGDKNLVSKTPPKIWGIGATIHSWDDPEYEFVKEIKKQVESHLFKLGLHNLKDPFNVCLVNYYKNGKEFIGWHSDREELGDQNQIASVSIGTTRRFSFRWKHDLFTLMRPILKWFGWMNLFQRLYQRRPVASIHLESGSLLFMGSKCQDIYEHGLERDATCEEGRLNLTFRRFHY
jgi:hypothetical protein